MSADTTHSPAPAVGGASHDLPVATALPGRPGVPFGRTFQAELRKMVDTRAGRWMVIVMAGLTAVILAAFVIWGPAEDATFANLLQFATIPLAMLLPIIGIMAATAEWSQRTGLVTFTLEPRRGRVVAAKALGALALGIVVLVVAFVAAALANLAGTSTWDLEAAAGAGLVLALMIYVLQGVAFVAAALANLAGTSTWDLEAAAGAGLVLALMIYVLQGVAFGLLFLNTPVAIVSVLVLPTIWSIATLAISSLEDAGRWLNLDSVTAPLFEGEMAGQDWAQLGTGVGVWVLLPFALGTYRVLTREVK
jgi:ABC-2 type transport system permease protein